jgi:hypothetical protein
MMNGRAGSRADEAESAENSRLSPLRVVRMRIDYGGLMWSCHVRTPTTAEDHSAELHRKHQIWLVMVVALS